MPGFRPDLTPKELLRLGVFGGKYMTDGHGEFPKSWFAGAKLCAERHDARLNCWGVNASQSLAVWRRSGWIHAQDPRGWFQWYCRYYMGRRSAGDMRQIRRWRAIKRHVAPLGRTASRAISSAAEDSGRRCSIGRTTAKGDRKDFKRRVVVAGATGFMTARRFPSFSAIGSLSVRPL